MCKRKLLSYPTLLSHISHSRGVGAFQFVTGRWMLLSWSGNTFVFFSVCIGFFPS